MIKRLAFVGAGAVGSYTGGLLAKAGEDVTLIDPWPDHIQKIKQDGLLITTADGDQLASPKAIHIYEIQQLIKTPVDVAFISTKSYDTQWATALIKDYLSPDGFVVSLQNGINEERIADIVGWGRTLGCIANALTVNIKGPGHVMRTSKTERGDYTIFRAGEVHGRKTFRLEYLVELLDKVNTSEATNNLWGERWSKLSSNTMINSVSAITGLDEKDLAKIPDAQQIMIQLGYEAVAVGEALGYSLGLLLGIEAHNWLEAGRGEGLEDLKVALRYVADKAQAGTLPSTAQDVLKGRRTEIDYLNGLIVAKGREAGIPTLTQEAVVQVVKAVERGVLAPDVSNLKRVQEAMA